MATEFYIGRVRSGVSVVVWSVLTVGIYFYVWLFLVNRELRRHLGRGSPGGRLVLFLLLPVIGWFLAIWFTGRSVKKAQVNAGVQRLTVPLYSALWAALVPLVGWIIAAATLQGGANRAWLKMNEIVDAGTPPEVVVQCPDCDTQFTALRARLWAVAVQCPQCNRVGDV